MPTCGTENPTRKNPPTLKFDKKLKRGEYNWTNSDTVLSMMKWKDKRNVNLLTNFHNPRSTTDVVRKEKYGSRTSVPSPLALSDYNRHMNCVDRFDQLTGTQDQLKV
ncbi:uncharacterized protein TNIN_65431 [Trichonephila inaurata madagascariensis]|uniref:PiggyBac transposable element-derived protein domain-containing protein n=1 Tax=Trichonephila inaurata madagascariensis TaxID=2747483 RepID=A0A8X6Y0Z0_9ARAC|nr:uncharacterized protein TNIN_65431 [Trichonephila inaurata madagascariensis]